MRAGLFFGTFNPVHRGHEALCLSFLGSDFVDELWILPTPDPPHKESRQLAGFEDRWKMLREVFPEDGQPRLCDIEKDLPSPQYTIRTIRHLRDRFPLVRFSLCIGGDTLESLSTWYRYRQLAQHVRLLVAERPGLPVRIPDHARTFEVVFCPHEPVEISSSDIRAAIAGGEKPGADVLHPGVMDYIEKKGLYVNADF